MQASDLIVICPFNLLITKSYEETMKKRVLILCAALGMFVAGQALAATPVGKWKTIDEKSGKAKSIVEIYLNGDKLEGKILELLDEDRNAVCEKCKGKLKNHKIEGLVFLTGHQQKKENEWEKGEILDPESGKVYKSVVKVTSDNQKLDVRGYVGIKAFGRSQTWLRAE